MQDIHITDLKAFKGCRRAWEWASPLRQNLELAIPYGPFYLGRAVHHCTEMLHGKGTPIGISLEQFISHEMEMMTTDAPLHPLEETWFDEQNQLADAMLSGYVEYWQSVTTHDLCDANLDFIVMEQSFNVPIYVPGRKRRAKSRKIRLTGRFDGLVRRKSDNTLWIWETKTAASPSRLIQSLPFDEQCGAYIYAAQEMYAEEVQGVIYNILRKKAPADPEVLKNGKLSKNKSIDTTPAHYWAYARAQHPDWSEEELHTEYGNFVATLYENKPFYLRIPVRRPRPDIDVLAETLYHVGMEMVNPKTPIYPTSDWWRCPSCAFREPCVARRYGNPVDVILETDYQTRVAAKSWREETDSEED